MPRLWEVLNHTQEFKYMGDIWICMGYDSDNNIVARNQRTQRIGRTPFSPYCFVEPVSVGTPANPNEPTEREKAFMSEWDKDQLVNTLRWFIKRYGWSETVQALREVVRPHVGWDSHFTELDNVLRRIERDFGKETKKVTDADRAANDYTEDKLDNPILPDGDPADHFS